MINHKDNENLINSEAGLHRIHYTGCDEILRFQDQLKNLFMIICAISKYAMIEMYQWNVI